MNIRGAIDDTMVMAMTRVNGKDYVIPNMANFASPDIGYVHSCEMYGKICNNQMTRGKLNRWLAWIQCSVVSWGVATLDEMKDINKKHANTHTED
jgi:hypothetical protein